MLRDTVWDNQNERHPKADRWQTWGRVELNDSGEIRWWQLLEVGNEMNITHQPNQPQDSSEDPDHVAFSWQPAAGSKSNLTVEIMLEGVIEEWKPSDCSTERTRGIAEDDRIEWSDEDNNRKRAVNYWPMDFERRWKKAEQVWMGNGRHCLQVLGEVSPDFLLRPEPADQQRRSDAHKREPWEETFGKLTGLSFSLWGSVN